MAQQVLYCRGTGRDSPRAVPAPHAAARGTPRRLPSGQEEEEAPGRPSAATARAACSGTRAGSLRMEVEMLSCRRELRTAAGIGDRGLEGVTHPGEDGAAWPHSSTWNGGTGRSHIPSRRGKGKPTLRGFQVG